MIPENESIDNLPVLTRIRSTPATTPEPIVLRDQYEFTCPACQTKWLSAPSLSMIHGHNSGHCRCRECKTFLHLVIAPNLTGDHMEAEVFATYLDRIQARQEPPREEQNG